MTPPRSGAVEAEAELVVAVACGVEGEAACAVVAARVPAVAVVARWAGGAGRARASTPASEVAAASAARASQWPIARMQAACRTRATGRMRATCRMPVIGLTRAIDRTSRLLIGQGPAIAP